MTPRHPAISSLHYVKEERIWPSDLALCALIAVTSLNLSAIISERLGVSILGKAVVAFAACVFLIEILLRQRSEIRLDRLGVAILLTYLVTAGLGVFWAYNPEVALVHLNTLYRDAIVALLVVAVIDTFNSLQFAVRSFYLSLAVIALLSTIQMASGNYDVDFGGLAGAGIDHVADSYDSWRLYGPFGDPNSYGRVLLIGIPLATQEFFSSSRRVWKAAAVCSLAVLLAALLGTYSRGALLGLLAAVIPFAISLRRYWWVQAAAVLLVVALASQTQYGNRIESALSVFAAPESNAQTDFSTLGRLDEMRLAGEMFKENIWGGLGPGGYSERFQQYSSLYHSIPRHEDRQAHSLPLEIAAEGGLIMLAAFSALCVVLAMNVVGAFRAIRIEYRQQAALIAGVGLSMASYLVASVVLHADFSRLFWLLCGLILALPICVSRCPGRDAIDSGDVRIPLFRAPSVS
jgi:O-antigen ligase